MSLKRVNDDVMENENSNRTKRIIFRITQKEHEKIERKWKASTCTKLSDYVRRCLFDRPIVAIYRNNSADDFIAEMGKLRSELNAIGNNFNQSVKRLHTLNQIAEFKNWLIAFEIEKRTLFNKIDEIKNHVQKVSESWLQ